MRGVRAPSQTGFGAHPQGGPSVGPRIPYGESDPRVPRREMRRIEAETTSGALGHRRGRRRRRLATVAAALTLTATLVARGAAPPGGGAAAGRGGSALAPPGPGGYPFAFGDSAWNIPLDRAGRSVLLRWVARRTGRLEALYIQMKIEGSDCRDGRSGYAAGDGGSWRVTTHPVSSDGRPDLGTVLVRETFNPCRREAADPFGYEYGALRMRLQVQAGQELGTVITPVNRDVSRSFASTNWLSVPVDLAGPNGRNTRSAGARGAVAGLDPRELVGVSQDGGRTFELPYTPGDHVVLPTYVQVYEDGHRDGQPYYYGTSIRNPTVVLREVPRPWRIRELAARVRSGRGTLTLSVDGRRRARISLCPGLVRTPIRPVLAPAGATVELRASGVEVDQVHADRAGARLMGLDDARFPWRLRSSETSMASLYALPWYARRAAPARDGGPPPAARGPC